MPSAVQMAPAKMTKNQMRRAKKKEQKKAEAAKVSSVGYQF